MKLVILLAAAGAVSCLDNGRGVTPPMVARPAAERANRMHTVAGRRSIRPADYM